MATRNSTHHANPVVQLPGAAQLAAIRRKASAPSSAFPPKHAIAEPAPSQTRPPTQPPQPPVPHPAKHTHVHADHAHSPERAAHTAHVPAPAPAPAPVPAHTRTDTSPPKASSTLRNPADNSPPTAPVIVRRPSQRSQSSVCAPTRPIVEPLSFLSDDDAPAPPAGSSPVPPLSGVTLSSAAPPTPTAWAAYPPPSGSPISPAPTSRAASKRTPLSSKAPPTSSLNSCSPAWGAFVKSPQPGTTELSLPPPAPEPIPAPHAASVPEPAPAHAPRHHAAAPIHDVSSRPDDSLRILEAEYTVPIPSARPFARARSRSESSFAFAATAALQDAADLIEAVRDDRAHGAPKLERALSYQSKVKIAELAEKLDKVKGKDHKKASEYEYKIGKILHKHHIAHPLAVYYHMESLRLDRNLAAL